MNICHCLLNCYFVNLTDCFKVSFHNVFYLPVNRPLETISCDKACQSMPLFQYVNIVAVSQYYFLETKLFLRTYIYARFILPVLFHV